MPVTIPTTHRDLLTGTAHGVLSTLLPDGQPHSTVVWVDCDEGTVLINTTLQRQKGRNMQRNPHVTLLVVDPANASRWIEIRGRVVEMTCQRAEEHADMLTRRYSSGRQQRFYGDVFPAELRNQETRVRVRIEPIHIATDAIFK